MEDIRLAIVEDAESDLARLTSLLERYRKERGLSIPCRVFRDGIEFLEHYRPEYDLILMDIEMPQLDGMSAARKLRETDCHTALIFITRMAQMAIRGYDVSAMDFIVKPVQYGTLSEKLDHALRRLERQGKNRRFLFLETGADTYQKIGFDEIVTVTKHLNYIIYATRDGEFRVRGTLRDAEKSFAGSEIVKCAKGLMVNLRHVERKERNLITVGGMQYQVTKPYAEDFTRAFMAFFREGS